MEDATAEESARLFRKIEYLSVIGNIAPMLGLLGTVIGILMAFKKVASLGVTAQAADLAGGIYLALVTTVEGLIVAIPALGAFAVFRNRVDQLVAEVGSSVVQVFAPLKRRRSSGPPKMPGCPRLRRRHRREGRVDARAEQLVAGRHGVQHDADDRRRVPD